jgi:pimeloyl-ACP methyl ester carboxylesterase
LLSGFPDTVQTWDAFAPSFESTHHVVKMAYPDMDASSLRRFWGYTTKEIVDALAVVIQDYRSLLGPDTKIHLMGHDWGSMAVLAFVQHYPDMVTKLIAEDVGILSSLTLKQAAVILSYTSFFAGYFSLSRLFRGNDELANKCLHWMIYLYPWPLIGPLTEVCMRDQRYRFDENPVY